PILPKNIGFGFQMQRSTIGIQEKLDAIIKYSYKIQFDKIAIGFGLQGSARRFLNDFTDQRLLAIDGFEMDPSIERIKYSKTIMNIGLGSVIRSDNFYIGISIPRILRSNLDYETEGILTREVRHAYMMIGTEFDFAPDWKFKPQLLYKYAEHSPNDIDLWTEFVYRKQLFLAANLRMGGNPDTLMESADLVVGFSLNDRWFTSLSIDFTFTELRNYENGSFELMIKYTLAEKN
ncbi:MAG: type IX secretion system membrane protein PorP/SprF, partial [Bacteroidia bacterium]|nr:type IX secretion system membrane protein PorP/SprF [Bacteroidia bacterium]